MDTLVKYLFTTMNLIEKQSLSLVKKITKKVLATKNLIWKTLHGTWLDKNSANTL